MKNKGLVKKIIAAILVMAFIVVPALDSLYCVNCEAGHQATVQASNKMLYPQAPSLNINNGQKGSNESDPRDCPFCFLNVFGLITAPPHQTFLPAISFQTPAVPIFLSLDLSPKTKPPQA
jgi:hypothetical protein